MAVKKSKIQIILVGCGAVSQQFYAPALAGIGKVAQAEVVGLVDPNIVARDVLARRFSAACVGNRIETIGKTIAPSGCLCIIATPPKYHLPIALQAFNRGWHVLCEKPIASTSIEATEMTTAAKRAQRLFAIGHYKRFMPSHRAIKSLIESKTLGRLNNVDIAEGGKFIWPAATDSFFRKEETPGGVFLDIGVHVLDLLLWWLGKPTSFEYADDARDGLEANSLLTAEFQQIGNSEQFPVRVRVRLSRDWETANCYVFQFEKAVIHSRVNESNRLELTFDDIPMTFAAELRDRLPRQQAARTMALETNAQAFIAQLEDIFAAIRGNRVPLVTGEDGAAAVHWIEQCYKARKSLP